MKRNITEFATVIRSKNSGPYELTLDIIFKDPASYALWQRKRVITPRKMASLYGVDAKDIKKIIWFEPAHAVKCTMKKPIPSGNLGERDIYGAQQHAPLLELSL